jgi:hypothetical protein
VRAGDGFTPDQQAVLERSRSAAAEATGLDVVLYVGELPGGRTDAERILVERGGADGVVVAVDPVARRLEIVTGERAALQLSDRSCGFVALAMTSSFAAGDLVGGIRDGLQVLSTHARQGETRHLDTL